MQRCSGERFPHASTFFLPPFTILASTFLLSPFFAFLRFAACGFWCHSVDTRFFCLKKIPPLFSLHRSSHIQRREQKNEGK